MQPITTYDSNQTDLFDMLEDNTFPSNENMVVKSTDIFQKNELFVPIQFNAFVPPFKGFKNSPNNSRPTFPRPKFPNVVKSRTNSIPNNFAKKIGPNKSQNNNNSHQDKFMSIVTIHYKRSRAEFENLKKSNNKLQNVNKSLGYDNNKLNNDYQGLASDYKSLSQDFQRLKKSYMNISKQKKMLSNKNSEFEKEIEALNLDIFMLENNNDKLNIKNIDLTDEYYDLLDDFDELKDDNIDLRHNFIDTYYDMKLKNESLEKELRTFKKARHV